MVATRDDLGLRESLRRANLRVTGVRLAILRLLASSATALEATEVLAAMHRAGEPGDRVTVYRTLNSLVEAGLAHRIDPGDRIFRFVLTRQGACTGHEHPHAVCDRCGAVECVLDAEVVVRPRANPGQANRFRVLQDVVLHGVCERCARTPPAGAEASRHRAG